MTNIEFFKEFIKYHEPVFHVDYISYCSHLSCDECNLDRLCENVLGGATASLKENELKEMKAMYPEYFI